MVKKLKWNFIKRNIQQEIINDKISEIIMVEFMLKIIIGCMDIADNINYESQKIIINEYRNELQTKIEEKYYGNIEFFLNELREKLKNLNIYIINNYSDINIYKIKNELDDKNKFISNYELNLLKKKILDIYEISTYINENKNGNTLMQIQSKLEDIVEGGAALVIKSNIEHELLKEYYKMVNSKINEVIKDISCKI